MKMDMKMSGLGGFKPSFSKMEEHKKDMPKRKDKKDKKSFFSRFAKK